MVDGSVVSRGRPAAMEAVRARMLKNFMMVV